MKKLTWSIANLFEETPKEVIAIQNRFKVFLTAIGGSAYIATEAKYTVAILVLGAVINEALGCFHIEK